MNDEIKELELEEEEDLDLDLEDLEEKRGRKPKNLKQFEKLEKRFNKLYEEHLRLTEGIKALKDVNIQLAESLKNQRSTKDSGNDKILLELFKLEREKNDQLMEKIINADKQQDLSIDKLTELINNPLISGLFQKNEIPYDKIIESINGIAVKYFNSYNNKNKYQISNQLDKDFNNETISNNDKFDKLDKK